MQILYNFCVKVCNKQFFVMQAPNLMKFLLKRQSLNQITRTMAMAEVHTDNACILKVQYKEGDLFSCPEDESLAHCVSADLKMSKGIAVIFKDRFKGVRELEKQQPKIGNCVSLKRDLRFVYYLVTKERYFHKPTYNTLERSLIAMREHSVINGVSKISMPKIGSGLDRLDWKQVKEMIEKVFKNTNIRITVYILRK